MGINPGPSTKVKLLFWIILGSLSTFFAEVVSGSYMFPFHDAWGLFAVWPLYTLHILVLGHVVFNYGKPRFYALFIAGAIFGMYEAYITKVLWIPFWGPPMISILGVAVVELIVLVFFWHAFMSFIVPLVVAENSLTKSREISMRLPRKVRSTLQNHPYRAILLLVLLSGLIQSANSPSVTNSLLSGISNFIVISLLYLIWNRFIGQKFAMKDLLPSRKQFKLLLGMLIVFYLITGALLRPEVLPGIIPHAVILLIYALLFWMLRLHLKKSEPLSRATIKGFTPKMFISIFGLFLLFAVGAEALLGPNSILMGFLFLSMAIPGFIFLILSIRDMFR